MIYDNELIPKYLKKKKKKKKKSNHKHIYEDCLIYDSADDSIRKASYCIVCGKIYDVHFFETVPYGKSLRRTLSNSEIEKKYENLKKFYVNDIFKTKFVDLNSKR